MQDLLQFYSLICFKYSLFKKLKKPFKIIFYAFIFYSLLLASPYPSLAEGPTAPPSDAELLEKQRTLEKDLEERIQKILEKILGPNQSEVKASVTLSITKDVQKKSGSGEQTKRKEENPLGETKFILPGVPAPKNVGKEKESDNVQKQQMEQEHAQTQVSFKVNVSNREVIAFYNEKLAAKEPEARKAITAMTDLKDNELKFIPGKFFSSMSTFWDDFIKDPKNILYSVLLFLFFLLLVWLFIPLTSFFSNYLKAMKEKGGIEVKMDSTSEETAENDDKNGAGGKLDEENLNGEEAKEGEEEMAKKYAPFEYINEENLKRLLGVFRKEPPQVIALVLSYLKPELVRQIYAELPVDLQVRVAAESSAVRQSTEEQVRMVDENIHAKIDFVVGGVDNLIRILEEVDFKIRDNILEYLMNHKPQIYEKVRASILLFDDFAHFPDLAIQTILRELKTDQLAKALRNASPEMTNKFFSNMSQGGAALLKEEMEFGRPITEDSIEQERQMILNKVKELEKGGKITIREKIKISVFESEDATSPLNPSLTDEPTFSSKTNTPNTLQNTKNAPMQPPQNEPNPNPDAQNYYSYGDQLYQQGQYTEAISYLQYAIQVDPQMAQAYQLLGHCYYSSQMMQEALQQYEIALNLSPNDEELKTWIEQFKQNVGA